MQRTKLAVITALLLTSGTGWAMDLLEAYAAAAQYDATFAAARSSLEAARERSLQADALTRPALSFGGGASVGNSGSKVTGQPFISSTEGSARVSLDGSLPLYRPANLVQQSQAKLSEQIAQTQFIQGRQDLVLRVSQAYFDVLGAQDALTSIAAQKVAVTEQLAQAKREFEVGTKTIVDTTEAQARFDQINALEAVAQADLLVKRSALTVLTGKEIPPLGGLINKPSLREPAPAILEQWTARAEIENPAVISSNLAAQIAKLEIDRNKAANKPVVDLVSSLGVNYSTAGPIPNTNVTGRNASVGVQFSVPLYTGGANDARIREAIALEERSRSDLQAAQRGASQGARSAFLGVTYGLVQVKALEAAEISANNQLSATRLGYQVGVRINLEVLNSQQLLANTRKDLAKARYDTLLAGLKLKSATGQLTEEDLKLVNAYLDRTVK
jgi:outer membrane protein